MNQLPITLADGSIFEFIIPAIIVVSAIYSVIKGVKESKDKQSRSAKPESSQSSGTKLNDLAERRRQQLRELAQRRRAAKEGQAPPTPTASTPPPPPVTQPGRMAQMQQRRADALQRQQQEERRRRIEAERRQQEREAAQAAELEQLERQRRLAAAQQQREMAARKRQSLQPQHAPPRGSRMAVHESGIGQHETVHRHVSDASTPRQYAAGQVLARKLAALDRPLVQQAIILKELLDRPVGMRHSDEIGGIGY
jgi:type IV secretory pathway VirB10-like protein